MGLFFKREDTNQAPLYTMGHQQTCLIVGLGNVGREYEGTRHNIGFACVDQFAAGQDFPGWIEKKDLKCFLTKHTVGGKSVIVMKPTTYMNESGQAVQAVQHFYKLTNTQTVVVHDELDVPFGQIRLRVGGSAAGNNGVKSLIQYIGDDFARIRIGVKNAQAEKIDSANFVLAKFLGEERHTLPTITSEVVSILSEYIALGELPHDTRTIS